MVINAKCTDSFIFDLYLDHREACYHLIKTMSTFEKQNTISETCSIFFYVHGNMNLAVCYMRGPKNYVHRPMLITTNFRDFFHGWMK